MPPITIVAEIPEQPWFPNRRYSEFEKQAYRDGWVAAHNKSPRDMRPNYRTHEEREAFNDGWDYRTSLLPVDDALG
jgi:hypothetical protein